MWTHRFSPPRFPCNSGSVTDQTITFDDETPERARMLVLPLGTGVSAILNDGRALDRLRIEDPFAF